jgi:NADP-dependent 3-hydroxy acid dehydrogenase YdfG
MGKDFAQPLIAEGYVVYGAARRIDRMAEIESAGGKVSRPQCLGLPSAEGGKA